MGIRLTVRVGLAGDGHIVQFHHLKPGDPASCDHQLNFHEQFGPKPAKFGIAVAIPLVGQSAEPAHQSVPILRFALALIRLHFVGRRAFPRRTEVITHD
jgi:hypothetical protein